MFQRITSDPAVLGGKPIIRGARISVELILEWMASGATRDSIVERYPELSINDVAEAIAYLAAAVKNEVLLSGAVS